MNIHVPLGIYFYIHVDASVAIPIFSQILKNKGHSTSYKTIFDLVNKCEKLFNNHVYIN